VDATGPADLAAWYGRCGLSAGRIRVRASRPRCASGSWSSICPGSSC
jgi:hypothetical protein